MCPSVLNPHISAVGITNLSETFVKPGEILTPRFERCSMKNPDHWHRLLRARRERPRHCHPADERDELAPSHSINSSARPDRGSGMVIPSVLAVLRLMYSSTFVACCTGRSAGFSPLRTRAV